MTLVNPVSAGGNKPPAPSATRKTLAACFNEAINRFELEIAAPLLLKDSRRLPAVKEFIKGTTLTNLEQICSDLSGQAEDKNNNAAQLYTTLDHIKTVGDAFIGSAPESVGIVWFGIGTLIMIGNTRLQNRLLICGTCDSIASIIGDCIKWEARMLTAPEGAPELNIWETDVPELVFGVLDFLWNAKPHLDPSRLKRIGSTLKDLFTKELQAKVDALTGKYEEIVKIAQSHFEDSVLDANLKTGEKINQIVSDLQKYVSIGSDVLDAVQRHALLYELDRQQAKINISNSHNIHYTGLNDRLTTIIKERGNRPVAKWLFKEDSYIDWKSNSNNTTLLCIKGPRGHGKSVAMMSAHRELQNALPRDESAGFDILAPPTQTPLVCHFFFKKGDQDIQHTRTGLEAILHQLLGSNEVRRSIPTLAAVVEVLNPEFGESDKDSGRGRGDSAGFLDSQANLTEAIRKIAEVIPERVYLMVDALDECQDRREQAILQSLRAIVKSKSAGVRIIISARDSIDIESELAESENRNQSSAALTVLDPLPSEIKIIEITAEKNSSDLTEYLTHDVGRVLTRRIDKDAFLDFFNSELNRMVKFIHEKAKGDFTLARMIIANLQQPSKNSLEKKIQQLPAAIGDIYMASLEALTADEQELVVSALRWVVWSVSGVTVIEVSDHYREIYRETGSSPQADEAPDNQDADQEISQKVTIIKPTSQDPYEDPEVKDIIYHLGNAGRDFFKFDRNTGLVSVDVSIREWISDDSAGAKGSLRESRGFNKYRDLRGNTVFKFTLTPSFVRYGDSLSKLFDEREAQMAMALDILRALNNSNFQESFMSWDELPEWTSLKKGEKPRKQRYEIDHWQDHIRALQKWWTVDSLNDPWWAELLAQLSVFMNPCNWYRWNIYRSLDQAQYGSTASWERIYSIRFLDEPVHIASGFGLHLMIDLIARESPDHSSTRSHLTFSSCDPKMKVALIKALTHNSSIVFWSRSMRDLLDRVSYDIVIPFLTEAAMVQFAIYNSESVESNIRSFERGMFDMVETMDKALRVVWLADLYLTEVGKGAVNRICHFCSEDVSGWHPGLEEEVTALLKEFDNDKSRIATKLQEMINEILARPGKESDATLWDRNDGMDKTPLHLSAAHPETLDCLIRYGADINRQSNIKGTATSNTLLMAILFELAESSGLEDPMVTMMLKSARQLILEGAKLDMKGAYGENALQLAAQIQNLNFFKLLCLSGDWDVHARSSGKKNALHYLFDRQPPKSEKKMKEVLEILRILIKMRRPDGDDLINSQNALSEGPLHIAVIGGYKQAVDLLIELGADVHDDDEDGKTCFHQLAMRHTPDRDADIPILNTLLRAGLDCTTVEIENNTPLMIAVINRAWKVIDFFLEKYEEIAKTNPDQNPLLVRDTSKCTLLHRAASLKEEDQVMGLEYFGRLVTALSPYVDIKKYIYEGDEEGATALQIAVDTHNLSLVKAMIAINPDISVRNYKGFNALDHVCEMIAMESGDLAKGRAVAEKTFPITLEIFYFLLANAKNFSFSFLETAPFVRDGIDGSLEHIDLEKVLESAEISGRDTHGWSLFDLVATSELEHLVSSLQNPNSSSPSIFARPTCIATIVGGGASISEDGYQITSFDGDLRTKSLKVLANNPLTSTPGKFYFEVEVPAWASERVSSVGWVNRRNLSNRNCRIGFRTILQGCWRLGSRKIMRSSNGDFEREGNTSQPSDGTAPGQAKRINFMKIPEIIGCGYDPVDNVVFFTVDGLMIWSKWELPRRRYFPTVEVLYPYDTLNVNFGQKVFAFDKANDEAWMQSGEVDATFKPISENKEQGK